ncbi:hypothetical protein PoB_007481000 [Plakobranchus ocellatus]|uniref:Uncharacterized protein n=1 Tax=Plakobranchus ocellatus TaxID=259542 RepID=A0AAV4DWB9_9GAST|nr:hypothetical protein PoB_007481000 [Plakobranchus ocellatus]
MVNRTIDYQTAQAVCADQVASGDRAILQQTMWAESEELRKGKVYDINDHVGAKGALGHYVIDRNPISKYGTAAVLGATAHGLAVEHCW